MVVFKLVTVVEVQRQRVVDLDRGEVVPKPCVLDTEDARDKPGRRFLVVGRNESVVEIECRDALLC